MKLTNAQLKAFDEWLFDFQSVDRKIAERKLELQSKHGCDENIGGGRSSHISKPPEEIVIKWSNDDRLNSLINFKNIVQSTIEVLDKELTEIFYLRWGGCSSNTWEEIAYEINVSRPNIYRKREKILMIFADKIGK